MDYSTLLSEAKASITKDPGVQSAYKALIAQLRAGKSNYSSVMKFTDALGKAASDAVSKYDVDVADLSNFGSELLAPIYREIQNTTLKAGAAVQRVINESLGIQMNPVDVKPNLDRINGIKKRFNEAENYEGVKFLTGSDVASNITRSAYDDTLKANAEAQSEAGYDMYVIRTSGGGCCRWCDDMCGRYQLGEEPDDFWLVHKSCTCEFEYRRGNTHTRITYSGRTKITENL